MGYWDRCKARNLSLKATKQSVSANDGAYAVWVKDGKALGEKRQYRLETLGWFKATGGEGFRVAKYVKSHSEGLELLGRYQAQVEAF